MFYRLARLVSFPGVPVFTTCPVVLLTSFMLSIILSPAATLALGLASVFPKDVNTLLLDIFSDPLYPASFPRLAYKTSSCVVPFSL
nr:MAG TPA: hypothetical protein [Caudoviricetes sp.]